MYVLFKQFGLDGIPHHTVSIGMEQVVFPAGCEGVVDVRRRDHLEWLLRHPSRNYSLAYERYGVVFDAQGQETDAVGSVGGLTVDATLSPAAPAQPDDQITLTPKGKAWKPRGRPKKR